MFQILIVDDDKNLKRALSLLLTDSGYRTFSAGSAREALHTLEKCRIDLMVLETALPGMEEFAKSYPKCRKLLVGAQGIPIEKFLSETTKIVAS